MLHKIPWARWWEGGREAGSGSVLKWRQGRATQTSEIFGKNYFLSSKLRVTQYKMCVCCFSFIALLSVEQRNWGEKRKVFYSFYVLEHWIVMQSLQFLHIKSSTRFSTYAIDAIILLFVSFQCSWLFSLFHRTKQLQYFLGNSNMAATQNVGIIFSGWFSCNQTKPTISMADIQFYNNQNTSFHDVQF